MLEHSSRRAATAAAFPTLAGALAALCLAAAPVHAQVRAGGHALYTSQAFNGTFGFGARAEAELDFVWPGLVLAGVYDRLFPECEDCSSTGYGGQISLGSRGPLHFGVGAAYRRFQGNDGEQAAPDDSGDWAFSYLAGLRLRSLPAVVPFIEFRQEFGSESLNEQTLSLGILLDPVRARPAPPRPSAR